MSVFHLEMSDLSSIGRFPGKEGGGVPASIGVHIFMQMTPTCDANLVGGQCPLSSGTRQGELVKVAPC